MGSDKYKHLLWVDLETTGLDLDEDEIIEIGAILTDADLNVLTEYEEVIPPTEKGLERILHSAPVRKMHDANGLLDGIEKATLGQRTRDAAVVELDRTLYRILQNHNCEQGHVLLAGSGVGPFDRQFVRRHMPLTNRYLHYAVLDVGVLRRSFELWTEVPPCDLDELNHRAMDDVRNHLAEGRYFRDVMGRA